MMFHAIGDLAQSLTLRRQSAEAQSDVLRLTQELSSGRVSDVALHLQGSFGQLADMESRITVNTAQRSANAEAATQATVMQDSLEMVQGRLGDLSQRILAVGSSPGDPALSALTKGATETLDSIVSALNATAAGRPLFAGNALDSPPLVRASEILTAARVAVAGAVDADDVMTALDTFFDAPGGGFENAVYQGGTEDMAPHRLGHGEEVSLSIRADDPKLRAALKDTVAAALAGDDTLTLDLDARHKLMGMSGASMSGSVDGIIGLRSDLGFAEERIDQASSRNAAERTSLEMARNGLVSADPFDTATALEDAQLRLEMIYTLTARTQRLNLVNFL